MKLKPIPYQSGLVFVDESANIEKGDYYWDRWNDSVSNNSTETGRKMANENKTHYKVIAQHNLNLEGIPHVDVGESLNSIATETVLKHKLITGHPLEARIRSDMFKEGYQANKKEFTREQMEKAIQFGLNYVLSTPERFQQDSNKFFQSLQHKIESIEPEEVKFLFDKLGYITYQRDGKTYIKAKINYENTRN